MFSFINRTEQISTSKMPLLKNTKSFRNSSKHWRDNYTNLGYNYHGNILKNVLSSELFSNPVQDTNLRQIERLIEFLIDQVKRIKLQYSITHEKDAYDLIN